MTKQSTAYDTGKIYRVLSLVIVLMCFGLAIWAYPHLPDKVPSHWNLAGKVNRYSGRLSGAFLLPIIMLAVLGLQYVVPMIDPKSSNFKLMGKAYWFSIFGAIFFLGVLYFGIIIFSLDLVQFDLIPIIVQLGTGLLFMVIGNYLPKIKYNYTFGIRTPWTLANQEVWYKTHRSMGPVFMITGIVIALTGFISTYKGFKLVFPLIIVLPIISLVYSYLVFRKQKQTHLQK